MELLFHMNLYQQQSEILPKDIVYYKKHFLHFFNSVLKTGKYFQVLL